MARPKIKNRGNLKVLKLVAPADQMTKDLCRKLAEDRFGGNEAEAIRFAVKYTYEHFLNDGAPKTE